MHLYSRPVLTSTVRLKVQFVLTAARFSKLKSLTHYCFFIHSHYEYSSFVDYITECTVRVVQSVNSTELKAYSTVPVSLRMT